VDELKKIYVFIERNHRRFLWITLGILFILDIITTTIGLNKGGYEQTEFMIPFVGNPLYHLIIKILAYALIFGILEGVFIAIQHIPFDEKFSWNKLCYYIAYSLLIIGLIGFIWIFLKINLDNISFILSRS